jgi:hypothetical protein
LELYMGSRRGRTDTFGAPPLKPPVHSPMRPPPNLVRGVPYSAGRLSLST